MTLSPKQRARLIKDAEDTLDPGETVLDATFGALYVPDTRRRDRMRARPTSLLATDRRLIFFGKRWGGYDVDALAYDQLRSVDHSTGRTTGELRLAIAGRDLVRMSAMPVDDVERLARLIRERIASTSHGDAR